jgi:phosphoribosyl-AMP cyclohydrolase / phosphoribosyl-ATP pyrophosphohydrolase
MTRTKTMTSRMIQSQTDLDGLDFDKGAGLVPVVVQDAATGTTLMLGYATREALEATLRSGQMHFWSRSRAALWCKGETSGNTLALRALHADCDGDSILALVDPSGPTCHTGEASCFGADATPRSPEPGAILARLAETLDARAAARPDGSYTARLLEDTNLRLKKLGEEGAELVAALATHERDSAIEEAADLFYHMLVALRAENITLADLTAELERRQGPGV